METNEEAGLSTTQALNTLYVEIDSVLKLYKSSQQAKKTKAWIKATLHHSSQRTTTNWISALFLLWVAVSFLLGGGTSLIFEQIVILVLFVLNISLELYDNYLRYNEITNRVQSILDKLNKDISSINWTQDNYPNLCSPFSPCITLQWTLRDGKLINLPWALLVKEDVIVMRPGQISPGFCEALDKHSECPLLHAKEVFAPTLQANEVFTMPKARKPLDNKRYKLLETPYLNNLRQFLEQALERPVTQHNQQRHLIMIKVIERIILPSVFIIILAFNLIKYLYLRKFGKFEGSELFFINPSIAIIPLLPITFPLFWNIANYLGIARFKTIFDASKSCQTKDKQFEEDADTTTIDYGELEIHKRQIWRNFVEIMKGEPEILTRSANIVHVLGSITALCCVDKKGILSWPNPTAEKVFFLHNNDEPSPMSSLENVNDLVKDYSPMHNTSENRPSAIAEVLDLTHNHNDPFMLHFDDQSWKKHLASLKPLGLAILLNTCNIDTQERYTQFCSHITCEAMYNENLVPVTNRRCLCELAKEIGFLDQAQKIFQLEQQLSTFRHLQTEMVRRDNKYARSLQLSTKLKFPFPHMFAVVVKETSTSSMQLLSEGTADIILDSCVDYWDGRDLCPLTQQDRKKIQDFYQRSSLTAYCTAFAYRPLTKTINSWLSDVYLELPSDSRHLYMNQHSPTPAHFDCKSVLEPKTRSPYSQYYSTDSLLYNDVSTGEVNDAEACFQMQCNQIFIGMVTMQYQALTDMVQLIEQLERACIRFVHFSKENELRSRVFSEKMGLESGWNCHISLLSDRNRLDNGLRNTCKFRGLAQRRLSQSAKKLPSLNISNLESSRAMSFSAPSGINMDNSVVKYHAERERSSQSKKASNQSGVDITSQESLPLQQDNSHDWQSLSCLTDSTEQSAPINFDMSNRAKLPRGIDKIRPHIELIDNVPLLVSLFTDCTPSATREMLNIMQDYGEVVCIMGSSENYENAGVFMQADASIAVKPLYPQMCQKKEPYSKTTYSMTSPLDLSCRLNSITCSLAINREDPISFYHLIMESRNFITLLWSSVQFWLCCSISLTMIELVATFLMLPTVFTAGQQLWFCCIVIPSISAALMIQPVDCDIMKKPLGKIQKTVKWKVALFVLWCYGTKFLPTIIAVVTTYVAILSSHCQQFCEARNCTCFLHYNPVEEVEGWLDTTNSWSLLTSRLISAFVVLLHFVVISSGFLHRNHLLYQKVPIKNLPWFLVVFILITLQGIYTILSFNWIKDQIAEGFQYHFPMWIIVSAAISPIVALIINEIVKRQEIRVNKRFLKRAKLDFGTKLGMNSPF